MPEGGRIQLFLRLSWEIIRRVTRRFRRFSFHRQSDSELRSNRLKAHLYTRLQYPRWFHSRRPETLCLILRQINIAERCRNTTELAHASSVYGAALALTFPFFCRRAMRYIDHAAWIYRSQGDPHGEGHVASMRACVLHAAGQYRKAAEAAGDAVRILDQLGDRWELGFATRTRAVCLYRLGRLGEARREARRLFDIGVEIGDAHAQITALEVLAKVTEGRVTAVQTQAALGRRGDDIEVTVAALLAEALRLRHTGQLEQAIRSLSGAARLVSRAQPTSTHLVPVFAWLATLHREAAEQPLLPHVRRARLRRARKSARRAVRYGKLYPNDLPHALRELGMVCALSGHRRRARRHLRRSAAWARRREAGAELAETNLQAARLELTGEASGGEGYPEPGLGAAPPALSTLGLAERFAALLEAGVLLASSDSAEATVRAIRETTQTLLRAERCRVVGLTTDWRPGHSAASAEEQEAARRAAEHRGPLVLNRPLATEFEPDAGLALPDARSALCAPVFVRDEMVGYFLALHSQVGKLFGEEEQQLAEFVARLAGAALERQQLQRDIRARVISAQEAERSRVARDLHDEVGQALTSVLLGVRLVESAVSSDNSGSVRPDDVLPQVAELRHHVVGALGSVQRLAFDLRPTVLDDLGLVAALRRLTVSAVTGNTCVELATVNLEPGDRLPAEIETTAYRAVQEAVTNVARHSRASKCSVVIGRTQRCLRVVIEDDGIGFRTDALSGGGLGLLGMKERAALVGGTLRVTSAPGQGTAISLEVPLDE